MPGSDAVEAAATAVRVGLKQEKDLLDTETERCRTVWP